MLHCLPNFKAQLLYCNAFLPLVDRPSLQNVGNIGDDIDGPHIHSQGHTVYGLSSGRKYLRELVTGEPP